MPGLTYESKSLYEAYKKQYSIDPFDETTIDTGKYIDRQDERLEEEELGRDLTHNSRRA